MLCRSRNTHGGVLAVSCSTVARRDTQIMKRDPQMMSVKHIVDLMSAYRELQSWGNMSRLYNTV